MAASPPPGDDRGARRTGVVLGVLATLVVVLGAALAVALISGGDDGGGGSDDPPATATAPTATVTTTEPPPQATATTPAEPTIGQAEAKATAARGASTEARQGGISIPPEDWDVRCTAAGGGVRSERWTCQATSSSGQCQGTIVAVAVEEGLAATREPRIACGE